MSHMTVKASPKPAKGEAQRMRRARRRLVETKERAAKDAAKLRDGYICQRCHADGIFSFKQIEAAHIEDAGMGGNPSGSRGNHQRCYVSLCSDCHRGVRSVHSGHVRIVVGERGGDGPVQFVNIEKPGRRARPASS